MKPKRGTMSHWTAALCIASTALTSGAALAEDELTDWREIAQQLVARRADTSQGVVEYRYYSFTANRSAYEQLAAIVRGAQSAPNPALVEQIDDWLRENAPEPLEAMRGRTEFDGPTWRDRKERTKQDTRQQLLDARAREAGAHAAKLPLVITTHSDGVRVIVAEDDQVTTSREARPAEHPLNQLDISLLPWEDAVAEGAAENQTISAGAEGSAFTIAIVSGECGDDDYVIAEYTFDESRGWAPLSAQLRDHTDSIHLDYVYGYASQDQVRWRPAGALRTERETNDRFTVSLWIVELWDDTSPTASE